MNQEFHPGDRVRHIQFDLEYTVVAAKQGQQQYFYDLKDEAEQIVIDVPENELERV